MNIEITNIYSNSGKARWQLIFVTALVGGFWGVFNGLLVAPVRIVCVVFFFCLFVVYKINHGIWSNKWQDKFITLFLACLLSNFIACWINRGQTILQSLQNNEVKDMFLLLFFYLLCKMKYNIRTIEKCIVTLYFIFIICYFLEYFIFYPTPVFEMIGVNIETTLSKDSEHRFRLVSQMIGFIGYFFLLNRILTDRNNPKIYYVGVLCGFMFIFLLGFRTEVIAAILTSLYLIYRSRGVSFKMIGGIISLSIMLFLLLRIPAVQNQMNNMLERQSGGQTLQNGGYIRIVQLHYFLYEHPISNSDYFFGSGLPSYNSQYGKQWYRQAVDIGIYGQATTVGMYGWVDWGVVGLSWMTGVPMGVLLYVFMIVMILRKYGKRNLYISAFYLFLLLTSVTTIEFYRQGGYVYHALILYLTCQLDKEKTLRRRIS